MDRDHFWHLATVGQFVAADAGLLRRTAHVLVEIADPESEAAATRWCFGVLALETEPVDPRL